MSSFKLWEIPQAIEDVTEFLVDPETGEIISEEQANELLATLKMEQEQKTEYIAKEIKNLLAEAEALKKQKQEFDKRQKSAERKAESLKNYLKFALNGEKWKSEDSSISISYRTIKDVLSVDDLTQISDDYFKAPRYESNLNKTALKKALQDGQEIAGVHLEDKTSLIIK